MAGDLAVVEDLRPFKPMHLRAAQPGVARERIRHTILGLQRGEQLLGLGHERDAQRGFSSFGGSSTIRSGLRVTNRRLGDSAQA